ncbi:MAG: 16S rRNA (adenine(1518)-N(6)/adenine(1519)-N(6))-dimethyltransferase RsmA [Gammaproteobacteria bacterium]
MSDHKARKRFGQNFLHDPQIIQRIIDAANPKPDDHFIEIGPGQGAITQPLAKHSGKLDVIEIDRDLAAALQKHEWSDRFTLHNEDALQFSFETLETNKQSLRLVGNLPYNISTPLLFHILESYELFKDIHVMLQKEVVQRMTASPGNKQYGRLTVALAARCHVESLFIIKPGAFNPAPKVDSAFARLVPLTEPLITAEESPAFDAVIRHAFGQRRKQLANALSPIMDSTKISSAGIDPKLRAENLKVEEFVELARNLDPDNLP